MPYDPPLNRLEVQHGKIIAAYEDIRDKITAPPTIGGCHQLEHLLATLAQDIRTFRSRLSA